MTRVHLSLSGDWRECHATQRACPRAVHLDNTTLTEAGELPATFVQQLFNELQPPTDSYEDGTQHWFDKQGKLHRDYGLPALISPKGPQRMWYRHGKPYRPHGLPAVENRNRLEWFNRDGKLHRVGKPAVSYTDAEGQEWWLNGKRHRIGGPAIIDAMGNEMWYQEGRLHREDGPAIWYRKDGSEAWYIHGKEVPGKNTMGFSMKEPD